MKPIWITIIALTATLGSIAWRYYPEIFKDSFYFFIQGICCGMLIMNMIVEKKKSQLIATIGLLLVAIVFLLIGEFSK